MTLDLFSRFTYHVPDKAAIEKMRTIRRNVRALAEVIDQLCPSCIEKETAFVNLQTVMMLANSAIIQEYPVDPEDK
jgi:hypothetical protein